MSESQPRTNPIALAACALATGVLALLALLYLSEPQIIVKAAGYNGKTVTGFGAFTKGASDLLTPVMICFFAALPLALVGGGVMHAFGSRQGGRVIGGAVAAALLVTCVKGVVA